MKPQTIVGLIVAAALVLAMIVWVAPVVGLSNSICVQQPYTSGCR